MINNQSGLNRRFLFNQDIKYLLDYYSDQIEEFRAENLNSEPSGLTKLTYERHTAENRTHNCQSENVTDLKFYDMLQYLKIVINFIKLPMRFFNMILCENQI